MSDVGRLIVPSFAEPHAHLDRAFSAAVTGWNVSGTLDEAVKRFRGSLERMTVESLAPGAQRALGLLYEAGVGHVRTHTAVGGQLGFRAWEAVEKAAGTSAVAVSQVPMPLGRDLDDPTAATCLREAAARGAVAVGGAPWRADDPVGATLGVLADAVIEFGLAGRATAHHCCSLARRPETVARAQAEALAAAGVAVVVCPVSNLSLQGRSCGARGLAPIHWLRAAGVRIGIGIDNIRDVVVPVGTADPLRAAWLVAIAGHLSGEEDLEWLGETVVTENRRICDLPDKVDLENGADLLVLEATSLAEAVALVPARHRLAG